MNGPGEAAWRQAVERLLKGAGPESLRATTAEGITIEPLYRRAVGAVPLARRQPGPWRVVARVDNPDAEAANAQVHDDLLNGADALSLVFEGGLAAKGIGVRAETADDLEHILAGVDLELIHLRLDSKPFGRKRAALLAEVVKRRRLDPARLDIDIALDGIGVTASHGTMLHPWAELAPWLGAAAREFHDLGFSGPLFLADGRIWHEAGANAAQELGLLLSNAVACWRLLEAAGIGAEEGRRRLSFLAVVDQDQLISTAKLRALRRLWAGVEAAAGLAPEPIRLHAETSWRMLTTQDTHNNLVRNTIAAFAAGVGGADTLAVLPFTSAHGLPDPLARRLARNTSLVLMEEGFLARVQDPAAGAGALEALTAELAAAAWAEFRRIEGWADAGLPGILAGLRDGRLQAMLAEARTARQQALAEKREIITGVTSYPPTAAVPITVLEPTAFHGRAPGAAGASFCEPLPSVRLEELAG